MKNPIRTALFLLIFFAFSAPSQAGILDALGITHFSGTYSHTSPQQLRALTGAERRFWTPC